MNLFELNGTGTLLKKITRYFIRSDERDDGTFMEEVTETMLNREGVFETKVSRGLNALDCNHIIRHYSEIGCQCSICGSVNCQQCSHSCTGCSATIGICCIKTFDGSPYCPRCYRIQMARQGVFFAGKVTGRGLFEAAKILYIPFRGKE